MCPNAKAKTCQIHIAARSSWHTSRRSSAVFMGKELKIGFSSRTGNKPCLSRFWNYVIWNHQCIFTKKKTPAQIAHYWPQMKNKTERNSTNIKTTPKKKTDKRITEGEQKSVVLCDRQEARATDSDFIKSHWHKQQVVACASDFSQSLSWLRLRSGLTKYGRSLFSFWPGGLSFWHWALVAGRAIPQLYC